MNKRNYIYVNFRKKNEKYIFEYKKDMSSFMKIIQTKNEDSIIYNGRKEKIQSENGIEVTFVERCKKYYIENNFNFDTITFVKQNQKYVDLMETSPKETNEHYYLKEIHNNAMESTSTYYMVEETKTTIPGYEDEEENIKIYKIIERKKREYDKLETLIRITYKIIKRFIKSIQDKNYQTFEMHLHGYVSSSLRHLPLTIKEMYVINKMEMINTKYFGNLKKLKYFLEYKIKIIQIGILQY
jgi:hypothetical protein